MEIKSQHELTTAGSRQSDVLIEALKKCQELEAENKALKEKVVLLEEDVDVWHLWRYEDFESKEDLKACLDRSGMIIKSNKIWTEEEFEALNF